MKNPSGYQTISAQQAHQMLRSGQGLTLVDLREPGARRGGSIPGSLSIPQSRFGQLAPRLLPDKHAPILVYCQTGARSWLWAGKLADMGYTRVYDMGGYLDWKLLQNQMAR